MKKTNKYRIVEVEKVYLGLGKKQKTYYIEQWIDMTWWDLFICTILFTGEDYAFPGFWRQRSFNVSEEITFFDTAAEALDKINEIKYVYSYWVKEIPKSFDGNLSDLNWERKEEV